MKVSRHAKIVELINQYNIENPGRAGRTAEQSRFSSDAGDCSRDIRDLRLTKVAGKMETEVCDPQVRKGYEGKYMRILKDGYVSMEMAQNILVVKTVSGMAMAVAASIDSMQWYEVVGCIAGDDTIMCAVRSTEETKIVMEK